MTATILDTPVDIPPDTETPAPYTGGDFDPQYPGSTKEHPYGYFDDGRPRKRRPHGSGTRKTTTGRMPASESQARTAAGLLARLNYLIAMGVNMAGMPNTGLAMTEANTEFENMAYEALLTDPALCKSILGAGATSGKAGLIMAYGMMGMAVIHPAREEIRQARANRRALLEGEYDNAE